MNPILNKSMETLFGLVLAWYLMVIFPLCIALPVLSWCGPYMAFMNFFLWPFHWLMHFPLFQLLFLVFTALSVVVYFGSRLLHLLLRFWGFR